MSETHATVIKEEWFRHMILTKWLNRTRQTMNDMEAGGDGDFFSVTLNLATVTYPKHMLKNRKAAGPDGMIENS